MGESGAGQREKLQEKINLMSSVADIIPGVVIIHGLPDMNFLFMSRLGLALIGSAWEEIKSMPQEEFMEKFLNAEDAKEYTPKIVGMLESNTDELVSYFQQVRTSKTKDWDWYMSSTKIFMRDKDGRPTSIITISMQIDPAHYFTSKAARLLEENIFLKNHYREFDRLTQRERMVLKLLAAGKSASQMATELGISQSTAETHRKRVREKLGARNSHMLAQYARAFDLL